MKLNEIFSFENLYKAHQKCRIQKQHKGEVVRFEATLGITLAKIAIDMASRKYKFGKYRIFTIFDPKKRLIEAPTYRDRVVMMCFSDNCLVPTLEKKLIYDNVACRVGKGTHFGMERTAKFLREEYRRGGDNNVYFLKCDISKYFPSMVHSVLRNQLAKCGLSEDAMWFIDKLLKEQPTYVDVGLPLGNQTSQWFALLYLNRIDRLCKEELQIRGYVRYMDDFILIHRDKKYLQHCLKRIAEVCGEELKLIINRKTQIGKAMNGLDFLGFRHILTDTGKVVMKLRASSRMRIKKYVKVLDKLEEHGIVDDQYIFARKTSYHGHIKNSNESRTLKNKVKPKPKKKVKATERNLQTTKNEV